MRFYCKKQNQVICDWKVDFNGFSEENLQNHYFKKSKVCEK